MSPIPHKKVEVFCGTGGVGKTTLATSRAIHLANLGQKILLITIDPAKRLKQVLDLSDESIGSIEQITNPNIVKENAGSLHALLMSPAATLARIASDSETPEEFDNYILEALTRPYGGMNEIMATVEVQYHLDKNQYDCIILDTPPGKHFIDFLSASDRIQQFFDKSFIEIFKQIKKSFDGKGGGKTKMLSMIVGSGIKKVLGYIEKVTGKEFVGTFVDAVSTVYKAKDSFLSALSFQKDLQSQAFSNWFLVTAVDQQKAEEATILQKSAISFMHDDNFIAINKCIESEIIDWDTSDNEQLAGFKKSLLDRERALKDASSKSFQTLLEFPEILAPSPEDHVKTLSEKWCNWEAV